MGICIALGVKLGSRYDGASPPATGPTNTVVPAITGTPEVGQTLTLSDGTWTGNGAITYARQWYRDGVAIAGASATTYLLAAADVDATITGRVTATDADGSTVATSVGALVAGVVPAKPAQADYTVTDPANGGELTLTIVGLPFDGGVAIDQAQYRVDGGASQAMSLIGLGTFAVTGLSDGVATAISHRYRNPVGWGGWSDGKSSIPSSTATVPAQYGSADWSIANDTSASTGGQALLTIINPVNDGGSVLTKHQVFTGAVWLDLLETTAGTYAVPLPNGAYTGILLRAINAVGTGADSAAKSVTIEDVVAPTVTSATINAATDEIDLTGVSEPGTYWGIINYSATVLSGAAIKSAVQGATSDAELTFAVVTGVNSDTIDKSGVAPGTAYLHSTIEDSAGLFSADVPIAFTQPISGDVTAPVLSSSAPSDGATDVASDADMVLTFSETVVLGTGNIELYDVTGAALVETFDVATGAGDAGGVVAVAGAVVTINPGADFAASNDYAIRSIDATAVQDLAGNNFAGWSADNTRLNFTTAAGSASLLGDGVGSGNVVTHTINAASASRTALPAVYAAGKYAVMVSVGTSKTITSATLDGVALTARASSIAGAERIFLYDGVITGGGTGDLVVVLSGADDEVSAAVWRVDGLNYNSSVDGNDSNRKTNVPSILSINTNAGDLVIAGALANKTNQGSTWVGVVEAVAMHQLAARSFGAANNLNATGGTPELFTWAPTVNFAACGWLCAIYR